MAISIVPTGPRGATVNRQMSKICVVKAVGSVQAVAVVVVSNIIEMHVSEIKQIIFPQMTS